MWPCCWPLLQHRFNCSLTCACLLSQLQSLYGEEDANMGADELQQFAATLEPALRGSEHQLRKCVGVGGKANTGSICSICSARVACPELCAAQVLKPNNLHLPTLPHLIPRCRVQRDVQVAQIDLTAMQEQYTKDVKAQVGQGVWNAACIFVRMGLCCCTLVCKRCRREQHTQGRQGAGGAGFMW